MLIIESICACCTNVMGTRGTALLDRLKLAGVDTPAALATTIYEPVVPFAVKAAAVAMPLALVTAVAVVVVEEDPLKDAPAPDAGAVKVTFTPTIGLWPASVTVACKAVENAALIVAV